MQQKQYHSNNITVYINSESARSSARAHQQRAAVGICGVGTRHHQ
jgi:hypothetical protein